MPEANRMQGMRSWMKKCERILWQKHVDFSKITPLEFHKI